MLGRRLAQFAAQFGCKFGAAHHAPAGLGDVRGAVPLLEHAIDGRLDPL